MDSLPNLETLQDDEESFVFRTVRNGEKLLVVRPSSEVTTVALGQLENAFALRDQLDSAWAVRPRALEHRRGKPTLLFDDPGGQPLARRVGQPWELTALLDVAIGAAAALREMHARGFVHRDIKPANLLVTETGEVRLFGFGLAVRVPRNGRFLQTPGVAVGTLAYMAPEQTGRIDRPVDARSDLYALGGTLYQLATGAHPFTANEPAEWIHAQLARPPAPVEGVPSVISAILLKLLAKSPEDRYQTAGGIETDLRRCRFEWQAHGEIERFPLGESDTLDRLRIGDGLYGRDAPLETMRAALDRVLTHGAAELVLISGEAGVGKSALGRAVQEMAASRALFAGGKSDQLKRDAPYDALAQALHALVREILSRSDAIVERWRVDLRNALGAVGAVVTSLVPELELLLGAQPAVEELPPPDARTRFQSVFSRLVAVFARPEHPLVLFIDDLQWADPATMELLCDLLASQQLRHLLVVAAVRTGRTDSAGSLTSTLKNIQAAGTVTHDLVLAPLLVDDVVCVVADALHCDRGRARVLAEIVHAKSGGNPFFALQFLRALVDEHLVVYDRRSGGWTWQLELVRAKGVTENVADLLARRLHRFSPATRQALERLACLGHEASRDTLAAVCSVVPWKLETLLREAIDTGLVVQQEDRYCFLHDRVQEAAYALIPASERAALHLSIGRTLWEASSHGNLDIEVFDVADQLTLGQSRMDQADEQIRAAELLLTAGRRARAAIAYASALERLSAARELVGDDGLDQHYPLAFGIEINLAECEFHTAPPRAAERLAALAPRVTNLVDLSAVTRLRVMLAATIGSLAEATSIGLDFLRRAGVEVPFAPEESDVAAAHDRVMSRLGERTIEDLVDLPLMTDDISIAVMNVLLATVSHAVFLNPSLHALLLLTMIELSLERGNCDASCLAYAEIALVLGPRFGDHRAGYRFCEMGYELVERGRLVRFRARVYLIHAYHVVPWTRNVRESRALLERSHDVARQDGDFTFRSYSASHMISSSLARGDLLAEVQEEAEAGLEFVRNAGFGLLVDCFAGQLCLIAALRGVTPDYPSFGQRDERSLERHFADEPDRAIAGCWYWIRKLQARVFAHDVAGAIDCVRHAEQLAWTTSTHFERAEYVFFSALACAAGGEMDKAQSHHTQLIAWSTNSPQTFDNRVALVEAVLAQHGGRDLEAQRAYERAVVLSRTHEHLHIEALACDLAGRFHATRDLETIANAYLRGARAAYLRLGADAMVADIEGRYPDLGGKGASLVPTATVTGATRLEQLDVGVVVRMSQAISSEIVFDRLLARLMTLAVEHAGAGRGVLILAAPSEHRIAAEAVAQSSNIAVELRGSPIAPDDAPKSILNYVLRAHAPVVLADTHLPNPYSADPYLQRRAPRSVMCLPLGKPGATIGALYLENHFASHVFTSHKLTILELLASQAAISLDNARLYDEVERAGQYLREAQRLSHTGSLGWDVGRAELIWSEETYDIFGLDPSDRPTTELLFERIHPEDRPRVRELFERVSRDVTAWSIEHRILLPDGTLKHLHVVARPVGPGQFAGAVMDVTAARRAEASLHASREHYAVTLSSIGDGVIATDERNMVTFLNPAAEALTGWPAIEAIGTSLDQVFRCTAGTLRARDGSDLPVDTRRSPIIDAAGCEAGAVVVFRDITQQRLAQEARALHLANARLELALRGSNIAIWDFDLQGRAGIEGAPVYSINTWERLGYEADASDGGLAYDAWHPERYHPDDLARVRELVRAYLAGEIPALEFESRTRHKEGHYIWWMTRGKAVRDGNGEIVRLIGTNVDITDRKHLEQELRDAKDAAEAASRTKDQFMANVSHEIRTPMNAILGMSEIALDSALNEDQRLSMSTVKSAAENLLVIIDDLLDFAKIEAGRLELATTEMSLQTLLRDTLRALAVRAHSKGLELVCDVEPGVPDAVRGDPVRLRQVLLNLVGNAIKFTHAGEVVVRVDRAGSLVRFSVRDTGIGIPPEKQALIFGAFEQADVSTTRRHGGTGLGLTIASRLVTLMGGTLEVESTPGVGSTFTVTAAIESPSEGSTPVPLARLRGVRVLVVDDNATVRQVIEGWLRAWGASPTVASSGQLGLTELRRAYEEGHPFGAAVLDAGMPYLDGVAMTARIRDDGALTDTPIVLLGSLQHTDLLARFRAIGGDTHVPKPAMPDELMMAILDAIESPQLNPVDTARSDDDTAARLSILLAEDDELNQQLMRLLLGKRGHRIRIARSGREALALVEAHGFDTLLLDVHLPEVDGFGVIEELRRRETRSGQHLHVIAMTARSRAEDREACLAAGMDDFLPKPFASARLWKALAPVVPLIDARVLLAACDHDARVLEAIRRSLTEHLQERMAAVARAMQEGNARYLREAAHRLSGILAPFSSVAGGLAAELEDCAECGSLDGHAGTLIERLAVLCPEVLRHVGDLTIDSLEGRGT